MTLPPARPRAAAASMLAGMAVVGAVDNAVAPLAQEVGLWQFFVLRALMALPLIAGAAWLGAGRLKPVRLWAVAVRSTLIAVAMLFYFGALAFVALPQALAGLFTSPIFVLLIGVFVLGQRAGPWRVAAVGLGFLGVLLVVAPWSETWHVAALMPVVGGVFYACGILATRTICAGEAVISLLAGLFVAQGLLGVVGIAVLGPGAAEEIFVARGWIWPLSAQAWSLIATQAVGSVIGVGLLFRGYMLGEASQMAVFEYSVFLFAAGFAWLFFGQLLSWSGVLGIALVIVAGLVIVLRSGPD